MTKPTDCQNIEQEALQLAAILDTMADGVFVVNPQGVIQRWNRAMERLTGYTPEEAIGESCAMLHCGSHPGGDCGFDALECRLFADGILDHVETFVCKKDGVRVPVIKSARVLRDAEGSPIGAVETLTDISSLRQLESEVCELRRVVQQRTEFHNIVGKSSEMQEVFRLIELAADSQVTALLQGETGTGKELAAKAIHFHSARRDAPFVAVNCSALSESLLESELFGHVRGAFTGAIQDRAGRFEHAHGGTVFLDEVGEIPPVVQVKLLRVLQERAFERVGESVTRTVDVRVIAATHRDLLELVRKGEFRDDLYYRLKVFPIHLPPLRARKEDIPLLIERFIEKFNAQTGKAVTGLTSDAMRIVMDYCWPGNIRELENAIEHAFVTSPGGAIGPFDLPVEIRRVEFKRMMCQDEPEVTSAQPVRKVRRSRVSHDELVALLEQCDWNKAEVARQLGISRVSVWRKMKALGVPLEPPQ